MSYTMESLVDLRNKAIEFGVTKFEDEMDIQALRFFEIANQLDSLIKSLYQDA